MDSFSRRLLTWHALHGRRDLPWQDTPKNRRTPYRVWVSEVMLQQTQVTTVIRYFGKFITALPDVASLAAAHEDHVMALWSGLGYYRRARHMHATAQRCVALHHGELPRDFDALAALPGIGRSTAGAIMALAHGQRHAILDGNVKRVLARHHGVRGWPGQRDVENALWRHAETHTPTSRVAAYTQAIMDLGATVCTRAAPRCDTCPLARGCVARREGLTADLPQPRPTRVLPEKQTVFIVLWDRRSQVLLKRRPPVGIWPALWSLPEADDAEAARMVASQLAELGETTATALPAVRHTFTHFRLLATPLAWRGVDARRATADDAGIRWCSPRDIADLGVPAPVRTLLQSSPVAAP